MSGTVIRAGEAFATGGLSEFTHGTDAFGLKTGLNAMGVGGQGYKPSLLSSQDPYMQLAQSGGAPLLTNIALGGDVDGALASYFGRKPGDDWNAFKANLSPDQQAAIDGVKSQLTQIQQNTDLRNQTVQKLSRDFPNVVSMTAPQVIQAKQAAGQEFDQSMKDTINLAVQGAAAKYAGTGGVSSGAAIQAEANAAAPYAQDRLNYTNQQGNQALNLLGQGWQQQYDEANALNGFQQKMLGQGAAQGFSAAQNYLNRNQQTGEFNANAQNQASIVDNNNNNAMLGALGSLGGTVLGAAIAGPIGGQVGKAAASGASTGGMSSNVSSFPSGGGAYTGVNGSEGYASPAGGYR